MKWIIIQKNNISSFEIYQYISKMSILSIGHLAKKVHDFNIFVYIFNDLKMITQLHDLKTTIFQPYINK